MIRVAQVAAYGSAACIALLIITTDPADWTWPVVVLAVLLVVSAAVLARGSRSRR